MAKERSYDYFWNSDSDRYYDAESMGDWLRPFFKNGIFNGQMQVTANDNMSVTVAAGYGYINGKHRHFLTPTTLDLEIASGTLDRIDSVILRRNDTERRIYLLVEKGGNAKTPVAPAPMREGAVYDLKLAEIYIAAGTVKVTQAEITDTRMNSAVCGWVAATVTQIDFTQIQAQFDAYFTAYKENISDQYKEYGESIQNFKDQAQDAYDLMLQAFHTYADQQQAAYEEWSGGQQSGFAQWRQDQEKEFHNWYLNNTEAWTNEFLDWFNGIKGVLGTDPAGALQNEIETLKKRKFSDMEGAAKLNKSDLLAVEQSGGIKKATFEQLCGSVMATEVTEQVEEFPQIEPEDSLGVIAGKVRKWQSDAIQKIESYVKQADILQEFPAEADTGEPEAAVLESKVISGLLAYTMNEKILEIVSDYGKLEADYEILKREQMASYGYFGVEWNIDDLMALVRAGKWDKFAIGDYFIETNTEGEKIQFEIAGKNSYLHCGTTELSKNHIVCCPRDCLENYYTYTGSNSNNWGYADSLMPGNMEKEANKFSERLQGYMTMVERAENKNGYLQYNQRRIFLPGMVEIAGMNGFTDEKSGITISQLPLFAGGNAHILKGAGFYKKKLARVSYWTGDAKEKNTEKNLKTYWVIGKEGYIKIFDGAGGNIYTAPLIVLS